MQAGQKITQSDLDGGDGIHTINAVIVPPRTAESQGCRKQRIGWTFVYLDPGSCMRVSAVEWRLP